MRASEIVRLRLEDLDWRNATVRMRARKTGHGALLPLTAEVGTALAVYLRDGRPGTPSRQVFVLHWLREGTPVSASIVNRAVDNALKRAGHGCAGARGEPAAAFADDRSARQRRQPVGDRQPARSRLAGHHSDLRRGRCRCLARGRAAVAGGGVMTGVVTALAADYIALRRRLGLCLPKISSAQVKGIPCWCRSAARGPQRSVQQPLCRNPIRAGGAGADRNCDVLVPAGRGWFPPRGPSDCAMIGCASATGLPQRDEHVRVTAPAAGKRPGQGRRDPGATAPGHCPAAAAGHDPAPAPAGRPSVPCRPAAPAPTQRGQPVGNQSFPYTAMTRRPGRDHR